MNDTRRYVRSKIDMLIGDSSCKGENIEKSIYNRILNYADDHNVSKDWSDIIFTHIYKQHACFVLSRLADNPDLIRKIVTKEILAKDVGFLTDEDIQAAVAPETRVDTEEVADGIFQCRQCGSKKTTYYSLQTRSADEPMTNFITCVECGNRWKM